MPELDYELVALDDEKLRLTLSALADTLNEKTRRLIYATYSDVKLLSYYQELRDSGAYEHGGKSKVHREVVRFPSPTIFDFVNTVLTSQFGPDWMYSRKAMHHDLVKPFWIVRKW